MAFRWSGGIVAAIPAAACALLMMKTCVDVPRIDEWTLLPDVEARVRQDPAGPSLFRLHNEHPIPVSRWTYREIAARTDWSTGALLGASWLATLCGAWMVALMLPKGLQPSRYVAFTVASALLFSIHSFECWTWGFGLTVTLAVSLSIGACCAVMRAGRHPAWLLVAMILAAAASGSQLNGFSAWTAGLAAIVLQTDASRGRRVLMGTGWCVMGAVCAATLIALSDAPPDLAFPTVGTSASIGPKIRLAGSILAAPLIGPHRDLPAAPWIGLIPVLTALAAVVETRRTRQPWLVASVTLCTLGVSTAAMIAWGRAGPDPMPIVVPSRYALVAAPAWIGALLAWSFAARRRWLPARLVAAALVLALLAWWQPTSWRAAIAAHPQHQEAATALRTGRGLTWDRLRVVMNAERWLPHLSQWLAFLREERMSLFRGSEPPDPRHTPRPARPEAVVREEVHTPAGTALIVTIAGCHPENATLLAVGGSGIAQNYEGDADSTGSWTVRLLIPALPAPTEVVLKPYTLSPLGDIDDGPATRWVRSP